MIYAALPVWIVFAREIGEQGAWVLSVSDSGLEALGALLAGLQRSDDDVDAQKGTGERLLALKIIVEAAELAPDSNLWQLIRRDWDDDSAELAEALDRVSQVSLQRDLELDGLALWSAVEQIERELKTKFADQTVENWYTIGDVFACI